ASCAGPASIGASGARTSRGQLARRCARTVSSMAGFVASPARALSRSRPRASVSFMTSSACSSHNDALGRQFSWMPLCLNTWPERERLHLGKGGQRAAVELGQGAQLAGVDQRQAGGGAVDDVIDGAGQQSLDRRRAALERNVLHVETSLAVEQITGKARGDDP